MPNHLLSLINVGRVFHTSISFQNGDIVFLKIVSNQFQTTLGIALIDILSRHLTDEVYLRKRKTNSWIIDKTMMEAFDGFGKRMREIEKNICKIK
eukprot:Gb_05862 [translate_table: standard]